MARPRKDAPGPGARERVAEAFWALLGRGPYKAVTIRALCAEAHVNANTIYRYFDGIDAMAAELFRENLVEDFPRMLLDAAREDGRRDRLAAATAADPALMRRFERILLFARSGSDYLRGLLSEAMLDAWTRELGLHREDLTRAQRFDLAWIIGGEIAVISNNDPEFVFEDFAAMGGRPFGRGVMEALAGLSGQDGAGGRPGQPGL